VPEEMSRFRPDGTLLGTWHFLACPDGVPSYQVTCNEDRRGFGPPMPEAHGRIILGLSGAYLRKVNGSEVFADRTSVLLLRPGDELRVAHPLGCGDRYTVIEVAACGLAHWTTDERWLAGPGWDGVTDDRVALQHRGLVAACARGIDDFEAAERTLRLVGAVLDATRGDLDGDAATVDRPARRRPATEVAHRKLVYRAREVLVEEGFTLGLTEIAQRVVCSPHHLSRVFHRVTGQSLTAHRHRLRMQAVLAALAEGQTDLRTIAATHGFADQAHLTRVVRQRLGRSPSAVRSLLTEPGTDVQRREGVPPRA
jgi:AraC-like DNA-binding protein